MMMPVQRSELGEQDVRQLGRALRQTDEAVQHAIDEIIGEHSRPEHGVCVRKVGTGYQMTTKPEHQDTLRDILRGLRPRAPLSLPALQTLAIIAYKQPVSAHQIQMIRRVKGSGVLQTLLKRKLIAHAGRKKEDGHALLYRTTPLFLKDFGLLTLEDLPTLKEFAEPRETHNQFPLDHV